MEHIDLSKIDRLDFLYRNNDPTAESEILRELGNSNKDASICGVAGSFYFASCNPKTARKYFRLAVKGAQQGWQLAEIYGRQVSMAISDGELAYARCLAERGYCMARSESREVTGRLAHQLGLAHGHRGDYKKAKDFYDECIAIVETGSYHWASARLGLAIIAMKEEDVAEAHRQLTPLNQAHLPATLAAYWCSVMAQIAAVRGDYSEAANWQREATGHLGSQRLADLGVSTAVSVVYLLKAGQFEEARRIATGATRLVQQCGKKNRAVAMALAELVRAGLSAELSISTAQGCASEIRRISRKGQENHRSGHFRRPQKK